MPEPEKPVARGAVAGSLALAVLILCTAAFAGIGALVGAVLPFGIGGFFVGVVLGFVVVYQRFKDI